MAQVQGGKRKSADGANARKRKNGTFAGSLFYASSAPVQSREYDAARNRKANADRMGLAAVTSSVHTQACGAKQLPAMDPGVCGYGLQQNSLEVGKESGSRGTAGPYLGAESGISSNGYAGGRSKAASDRRDGRRRLCRRSIG